MYTYIKGMCMKARAFLSRYMMTGGIAIRIKQKIIAPQRAFILKLLFIGTSCNNIAVAALCFKMTGNSKY